MKRHEIKRGPLEGTAHPPGEASFLIICTCGEKLIASTRWNVMGAWRRHQKEKR